MQQTKLYNHYVHTEFNHSLSNIKQLACFVKKKYQTTLPMKSKIPRVYNFLWRRLKEIYNHVHNVLRLFNGWEKLPFNTSETRRDY